MTAAVVGEVSAARDARVYEGERGRFIREYRRVLLVQTTSQYDDANVVMNAAGVPKRYYPFITSTSSDAAARVVDIIPRQRGDNPYVWEVEILWTTQPQRPLEEQDQEDEGPADVLDELPDIEFGTRSRNVPASRVYSGSSVVAEGAFLATNGEPFNPQPEIIHPLLTLTIARNEATFDQSQAASYIGSVNSDTFWGYTARQVLCESITARLHWNNGIGYWRVTYSFLIDLEVHDLRLVNKGSYYLEESDPDRKRSFLDKDGQRFIGLLDGNGDQTTSPTYTEKQGYPALTFATLGLPGGLS